MANRVPTELEPTVNRVPTEVLPGACFRRASAYLIPVASSVEILLNLITNKTKRGYAAYCRAGEGCKNELQSKAKSWFLDQDFRACFRRPSAYLIPVLEMIKTIKNLNAKCIKII